MRPITNQPSHALPASASAHDNMLSLVRTAPEPAIARSPSSAHLALTSAVSADSRMRYNPVAH